MKKKIVSLALAVCLIAIAAVGTLAYFTDSKEATNTFTVGNVKIELTEPNWDKSGKVDAPDVYAGERLAKDPTVTNVGNNPCFVRVKVTGLNQFGDKGMIALTDKDGTNNNFLGEGWVKNGDYYYYTKPLCVEGTENESYNTGLSSKTTALFEGIRMPAGLEGGEVAQPIVVTAEAVQAQGAAAKWADVKTMGVADIAAWFDTCGMNAVEP